MVVCVALAAMVVVAASSAQADDEKERTRVILVGDSMVWELGRAMEPLMEEAGYDFKHRHKTSDSIRSYAANNRMRDDLRKYKPDVVMISLGANEALIPRPDSLIKPIKKIVGQVGDKPCYWIGPPMWTQDTGVVKLLEEHSGPCKFYNSSPLELKRRKDGYHPNKEGSKVWAEAFLAWMKDNPPAAAAAE